MLNKNTLSVSVLLRTFHPKKEDRLLYFFYFDIPQSFVKKLAFWQHRSSYVIVTKIMRRVSPYNDNHASNKWIDKQSVTQEKLAFKNLKSNDMRTAILLKNLSNDCSFQIYLGFLQRILRSNVQNEDYKFKTNNPFNRAVAVVEYNLECWRREFGWF